MKNIKKKIFSISISLIVSNSIFIGIEPTFSGFAQPTGLFLGDVNYDGYFNLADSVYIQQYLYGTIAPSGSSECLQITAMDVNEDYIIDGTDAAIIQYMSLNNIYPTYTYKELYSSPDNSARCYYKHQCSSTDPTSKTQYCLSNVDSTINSLSNIDLPYIDRTLAPDDRDNENINVVELTYGNDNTFLGSGFIINNHVIATAAHCVYNSSGFISNLKVNIYNSNGQVVNNNLEFTSQAQYIHIPKLYYDNFNNATKDNYDYALIYVADDLLQQNITGLTTWNMGVATKEFMDSNELATTSGFRWYNNTLARYYNQGNVNPISSTDHNLSELRITTSGTSFPGKSGGVLYYESGFSTYYKRSAIAVVTGAADTVNGGDTWATKINPTLLKFFFHNNNL